VSLPWFRLDTNVGSHDKVLALLDDRAPAAVKYRALWSWTCSIGWSVDSETDGRIPRAAFHYIHATPATAKLLVKYGLWDEEPPGYVVHNYARRQPLASTSQQVRDDRRREGRKAACRRWHGDSDWDEVRGVCLTEERRTS
jgi:hypothetical protein